MTNKNLNGLFGIPEDDGEPNSNTSNSIVETSDPDEIHYITEKEDFDDLRKIRENLQNYTHIGEQALNELLDVAMQSQNPRAYEVIGQLIKILVETNREISDQVKKNIDIKAPRITENNITHNNLILSTDELLEKLQNKKKKEE